MSSFFLAERYAAIARHVNLCAYPLSTLSTRTGTTRCAGSRPTSNGVLEAINSLVQAAKRRARGYRTDKHYIAMIYMTVGKLSFGLPT